MTLYNLFCFLYLLLAVLGLRCCMDFSLWRKESGGHSLLWCRGFSSWCLLLWSTGPRQVCFSSCGTCAQGFWLPGSRAQAQQLWCIGLAKWDLPEPGTEPMSPALVYGFLTWNQLQSPWKPCFLFFFN